jgi:serine/threonine protein kinase
MVLIVQVLEKFHRFEPEYARFYCGCVVLAIGHLHRHGIIFRDLKPENLLLTSSGYLKLIDMGFAKRLVKGEKTYTLCGTPYYLAPEMILHRGHGFALDWWTVGVLTYEMLEGEPPFQGNSEMEVYSKVTRLQYVCPPRFPELATDIIAQLLKKEPENRLGNLRNEVNDVMAHPWFHGFSWDDLLEGRLRAPYVPPVSSSSHGGSSTKKAIDLSDSVKCPADVGFWPGW